MVEFRYRLQDLMAYFNKSQADIVRETGLGKSVISNYIRGTRKPKQDKIALFSEKYNVSIPWLLGIEDAPMFDEDNTAPITPEKQARIKPKVVDYMTKLDDVDIIIEQESQTDSLEKILKMYFTLSKADRQTVNNMIEFLSKKGSN